MADLKISYDKEADAIYITLSDKDYAFGEDIDHERRIDYAADHSPIGIELTCVSEGVLLNGLPRREEITKAIEGLRLKVLA